MNVIRHAPAPLPSLAAGDPSMGTAPHRADTHGTGRAAGDAQLRHVHRARDFGVGYGNSSGYASGMHFFDGHVDPPFRVR